MKKNPLKNMTRAEIEAFAAKCRASDESLLDSTTCDELAASTGLDFRSRSQQRIDRAMGLETFEQVTVDNGVVQSFGVSRPKVLR